MAERLPLTRERVVDAAAQVADDGGLASVSMRNVGRRLGVEAMSLYHHIAGKEQLLDLLADWIFARVGVPEAGADWRSGIAAHSASLRAVLSAHPWALSFIDSRRAAGPALLRHHNAVLGFLRSHGFSVVLAAHAFSALDSYVYGFVLTEQNLPMKPDESAAEFVAELDMPLAEYPHFAEMIAELVSGKDYRYADEFEFGLHLILDGLARQLGSHAA